MTWQDFFAILGFGVFVWLLVGLSILLGQWRLRQPLAWGWPFPSLWQRFKAFVGNPRYQADMIVGVVTWLFTSVLWVTVVEQSWHDDLQSGQKLLHETTTTLSQVTQALLPRLQALTEATSQTQAQLEEISTRLAWYEDLTNPQVRLLGQLQQRVKQLESRK